MEFPRVSCPREMVNFCWPYFDPDYENLSEIINPPRVIVDNKADDNVSLVKIDSVNRPGTLLEVVQVLTDLDLNILKAYISSDGGWFMDVFHVTDQLGNKVTDQKLIAFIQHSLGMKQNNPTTGVKTCLGRMVGVQAIAEHTVIELTGTDRPGLLSEISAILTNLKCNVVAAEAWTHNARVACVVYLTDVLTDGPIEDSQKLLIIKEQLCNVLKGKDDKRGVRMAFSMGLTHTQRRLHQIMFADRDYEASEPKAKPQMDSGEKHYITIENCTERGYSVVNIQCRDRPKLLFDTVCTLTDMQYVVFHACVHSNGPTAIQEYYIRHLDGCTLDTQSEKQRVIKCLEAAIERRVSEGLRLEVCMRDRVGLLSDITRIFRESGLSVTRADVSTQGQVAVNTFYVSDTNGGPVDTETVDNMRKKIGQKILHITNMPRNVEPCISTVSGSSFFCLWQPYQVWLGTLD